MDEPHRFWRMERPEDATNDLQGKTHFPRLILLPLGLLVTAATGLTHAQGNQPPGVPTNPHMDLMSVPLGIESPQPLMGWVVHNPDASEIQTAYQILVSERLDRLAAEEGTLWDSGKVLSNVSGNVRYEGAPLQAG